MFGYVTIKKEELKLKDFAKYQAYYCGICQDLKDSFGMQAQPTLTYDMTFLAVLLSGLYESETSMEKHFCPAHPGRRHPCMRNICTEYAADMNLMLCYYNLLDNWRDEGSRRSYLAAKILRKSCRRVLEEYPKKARAVRRYLKRLHECEQHREDNLDLAAGYTGELMGEIFAWKKDIWEKDLRRIGFYLGKFIYLMDAYEDVEKDRQTGNYNPFETLAHCEDFEERAGRVLTMMAAEAARAFERLPVLENADILRNILYAGIWERYDKIVKKRQKAAESSGKRLEEK